MAQLLLLFLQICEYTPKTSECFDKAVKCIRQYTGKVSDDDMILKCTEMIQKH